MRLPWTWRFISFLCIFMWFTKICGKVGVAGLCYNAYTVTSACKVGWNWNVYHVCATPIVDGKACKAAFVFKVIENSIEKVYIININSLKKV